MAEVKIRASVGIKCGEGKRIHVPPALIEEHGGQKFLRLRPSSHAIVALVTQATVQKTAAFSSSPKLQELMKMRNEAAAALHSEEAGCNEPGEEKEDLWEDALPSKDNAPESKKRKREVPAGSYVVQISLAGPASAHFVPRHQAQG